MAPALGMAKRGDDGQIESFTEPEALTGLESLPGPDKPYLAAGGIYVFRTDLSADVLKSSGDDFGKNIIPKCAGRLPRDGLCLRRQLGGYRNHPHKIPCQEALKKITYENIPAFISSEIIQEIIYRYRSLNRPKQALQVAKDVMTIIPKVLPVTENEVRRVLTLIPEYSSLKARDLIHVAVMVENGISTILSADTHFELIS